MFSLLSQDEDSRIFSLLSISTLANPVTLVSRGLCQRAKQQWWSWVDSELPALRSTGTPGNVCAAGNIIGLLENVVNSSHGNTIVKLWRDGKQLPSFSVAGILAPDEHVACLTISNNGCVAIGTWDASAHGRVIVHRLEAASSHAALEEPLVRNPFEVSAVQTLAAVTPLDRSEGSQQPHPPLLVSHYDGVCLLRCDGTCAALERRPGMATRRIASAGSFFLIEFVGQEARPGSRSFVTEIRLYQALGKPLLPSLVNAIQLTGNVDSLAVDQSGRVVINSPESGVRVFELTRTGQRSIVLGGASRGEHVQVAIWGSIVFCHERASGTYDSSVVRLWDVQSAKAVGRFRLQANEMNVPQMSVCDDGEGGGLLQIAGWGIGDSSVRLRRWRLSLPLFPS